MAERALEFRALRAACAAADAHGMPCQDAVVLPRASNVLVHLKPAPAVARVMTATAALHDDVERWLEREVAVGSFLAAAAWPSRRAADAAGTTSARRLLSADMDSLRASLVELTPRVFGSSQPAQALHGDTGLGNVLSTDRGLLWNDLEDACIGPVAWDLAGLVVSARARGQGDAYISEVLDAYGGPGADGLSSFIAAHELYTTIWRAHDAQRRSPAEATRPQRSRAGVSAALVDQADAVTAPAGTHERSS